MENRKIKIIFIGTPEFGAIILEELIKGGYPPVLVITSPDKPVGRKQVLTSSSVKVIAREYGISLEQPNKITNLKLKIRNLEPDLGIVAAYGEIIPKDILNIPNYGFLNVHPSLLPKYRGSSPIQFTILNGDEETGVTVMLMDEKMDHGPIVSNSKSKIQNPKIGYTELHNKLAASGAKLLLETIPKWLKGEIKPKPQKESKATYTKILTKEDGKIKWQEPAEKIERKIRAFHYWPTTYTTWEDRGKLIKIKILKARVFKYRAPAKRREELPFFDHPDKIKYPIGKVLVVPQNEIGVQCGKDFLVIEKLQMEGKKEMVAEDFLRGHAEFIGAILE